jgi:PKD repeat protein
MVYVSNGDWNNHPPQAPTNLISKLDEFDVILSWDRAADIENSDGLTYNLKVGTSKDSCNVMQVLTAADGHLRIPKIGNVQTNNSWYLENLPTGKYYWSVQAVDNTYRGGPWAEESSFELGNVFVDFEYDTVCLGEPTTFTDRCTSREGSILSWHWDFGDGGISNEQNPQYFFTQSGDKDVKLTIGLVTGSYYKTKKVIVKPKPAVQFAFEPVSEGGEIMTFENQTDTFGISIAEWKWDFGDDNVFVGKNPPQHGYLTTGNYAVQLSVMSSNGCSDSIAKDIQVCYGLLRKPELLAYGPNTWYLVCSNDTALYYKWYYNGNQLLNQNSYILVTDNKMGEYQVAISSDDECYISSDMVSIPITGVFAIETNEFIRIFPNPNDGYFVIHVLNGVMSHYNYRLIDIQGKEIASGMIKSENNKGILFRYDHIKDGIYIIEIYNDRTRVYSGKIVTKKQ